ncbi:hypothetical protein G7072_02555 [Nocardioides sp. HDW12B]|uniref:DUF6492 family protein n=1 Tax=Nocardioides sp. HDW12B TaxID=2714939 RepID=UPI00140C306D|nr:DUF6492 family protein [Nocardioides sp. HDW12B]QIK65367.1 hypothetical protein G7072_02555 [Nocardioides sp. HDW12B]
MTTARLTFVSVVFGPEVPLLRLQARSFAAFAHPDVVAEVIVLDNTAGGMARKEQQALVADFGVHGPSVRVLRGREVMKVPATTGWRSQQVLKLGIAEQVGTPRYVVLDAKNHLVAPLGGDFFEAPDGRIRMGLPHSYAAHSLRPSLERVLTYLGLDLSLVDRFTTTATPFVLDTATVRSLVEELGAPTGRSFAEEFLDHDLTEFFLYSGWVRASGPWEELFDFQPVECPVLWPRNATEEGVAAVSWWVSERGTPFLGVHRRALLRLDPAGLEALASMWADAGLFVSAEDAATFITDFRRSCVRAERRAHLREAPGALRQRLRRLRGSTGTPRPGA